MGFTVKRVERLLTAGRPGRHADHGGRDSVRGLYLCIRNKNNASWSLRYQLNDKPHWMGLGSASDISLAQAREKASVEREKLVKRVDPLAQRRAERAEQAKAALASITFAEASQAYIEAHEASWKNARHRQQWTQTLKDFAFPHIGNLPVASVDKTAVLHVLEHKDLWKTKTETASRLRGRIESVLDWCKARGYRPDDVENPAKWDGNLEHLLPSRSNIAKVAHHRALPYDDLPAFAAKLRSRQGIAAKALLFTILTAGRTQETLGARWSEIDFQQRTWTVPPERMKGGIAHIVLLAPQVIDLLRGLPREGDGDGYVFIGSRPGAPLNPKALHRVCARLKVDAVPHGLRSSFSDWANECTAHSHHAIEISLAHKVGNDVEQAYRRGPMLGKRARLMSDWARFVMSPPVEKTEADTGVEKADTGEVVVPIRRRWPAQKLLLATTSYSRSPHWHGGSLTVTLVSKNRHRKRPQEVPVKSAKKLTRVPFTVTRGAQGNVALSTSSLSTTTCRLSAQVPPICRVASFS